MRRREYAIIGAGCRLPGNANSLPSLFNVLRTETDCLEAIPPERWNRDLYYSRRVSHPGRTVLRKGGFMNPFFTFDHEAFGLSHTESLSLDPSCKVLLEVTLDALIDSNIEFRGSRTGVFIGSGQPDFTSYSYGLGTGTGISEDCLTEFSALGSSVASHSQLISKQFDLRGPCCTYVSGGSSSASAFYAAIKSLDAKECSMAIVGGINPILDPAVSVAYSRLGVLSPTDESNVFDAGANGFVRSEGCGVVVLVELREALERNVAKVYGVVMGIVSTFSENSELEISESPLIPNPVPSAMESCVRLAFERTGIDPVDCFYVESDCRGLPDWDVAEVNSIGKVSGRPRARGGGGGGRRRRERDHRRNIDSNDEESNTEVRIGSVKSSFGDCEVASFIVSLLKVLVMCNQSTLLPTRGIVKLNPKLKLKRYGLNIQQITESFDPHNKIFTVNSFGLGGSNLCLILRGFCREPYSMPPRLLACLPSRQGPFPFLISARSIGAVTKRVERLKTFSRLNSEISQHDLSYSINSSVRTDDQFMIFGIGESCHSARFISNPIAISSSSSSSSSSSRQRRQPFCFVFSGHGPQNVAMGRSLYRHFPVFRNVIDQCSEIYYRLTSIDLVNGIGLFGSKILLDVSELRQIMVALPCLVFIQIGLFELFRSFGVRPDVVIGHSFGSICALYASGAVSFEEVIEMAARHGRFFRSAERLGKLVAVGASSETMCEIIAENNLQDQLYIAADTSPMSCTVGGGTEAVQRLDQICEDRKFFHRILSVPGPYHTRLLSYLRPQGDIEFGHLPNLREPTTRYVSLMTGTFHSGPFRPTYLVENVLHKVRFREGVYTVLRECGEDTVFLELAAHSVLTLPMRQCDVKYALPTLVRGRDEVAAILNACALLTTFGCELNWDAVTGPCIERIKNLPGYPFDRSDSFLVLKPKEVYRRTDLLGRKVDCSETIFRERINVAKFPWVKDHIVCGRVVFPPAGYIEACCQIMRFLVEEQRDDDDDEEEEELVSVSFRDILFFASMDVPTLPLDFRTMETKLQRSRLRLSSRLDSEERPEGEEWVRHMECRLGTCGSGGPIQLVDVSRDWSIEGGRNLMKQTIYQRFEVMLRLRYGNRFRCIDSCVQGDEEVVALLSLETLGDIEFVESRYLVHPTILEGIFQVILLTYRQMRTYVPKSIETFILHQPISPEQFPMLLVKAWLTDRNSKSMKGCIEVVDHATKQLLLEVRGFEFACVEAGSFLIASNLSRETHLETIWQPVSLPLSLFSNYTPRPSSGDDWAQILKDVLPKLPRFVFHGIGDSLAQLRGLTIPEENHAYLNWIYSQHYDLAVEGSSAVCVDDGSLLIDVPDCFSVELALIKNVVRFFSLVMRRKDKNSTEPERRSEMIRKVLAGRTVSFRAGIDEVKRFFEYFVVYSLALNRVVRVLELSVDSLVSLLPAVLPVFELHDMAGRTELILSHESPEVDCDYARTIPDGYDSNYSLLAQSIQRRSIDVCLISPSVARLPNIDDILKSVRKVLVPHGIVLCLSVDSSTRFWLDFVYGAIARQAWVAPAEVRTDLVSLLSSVGFEGATTVELDACRLTIARSLVEDTDVLSDDDDDEYEGEEWEGEGIVSGECVVFDDPDFFHLSMEIQDRIEKEDFTPLLVVTRGLRNDPPQLEYASQIGLVRVLCNEFPDWIVKTIDLPDDDDFSLLHQVRALFPSLETEAAMHDGVVSVPRVMRVRDERTKSYPRGTDDRCFRLFINSPGDLSSLSFHEMERPSYRSGEVLVRVRAVGLNLEDQLLVWNELKRHDEIHLGLEFSGIVCGVGKNCVDRFSVGDEVLGFAKHAFSSHVVTSPSLLCRKPDHLSFVEAAAVPIAYTTAYQALINRARVKHGERVLIHSAEDSVGQAAIQLALSRGAVPIATVRTPAQRQIIAELYSVSIFGSSDSDSWDTEILEQLRRRDSYHADLAEPVASGVDVVLNSLPKDHVERGLRMLLPFGSFVEIGKFEDFDNAVLRLAPFHENLSYSSVHLHRMIDLRPREMEKLLYDAVCLLRDHIVKCVRIDHVFQASEIVQAFRCLSSPTRCGKVVVEFPDTDDEGLGIELRPSKALFSAFKTYVLSGGLGVLGFELAKWMIENGARFLVLLSRTGILKNYQKRFILRSPHAKIRVVKTDVSVEAQVRSLFSTDLAEETIGGLFHLAAVVHDGAVAYQTRMKFEQSFAPKITGIENLMKYCSPECVVLFSSVASLIGNLEQAAYAAADSYLDAYASYLIRTRQIPTKVLYLGAVVDFGAYAESLDLRKRMEDGLLLDSAMLMADVLALVRTAFESPDSHVWFIPDIDFRRLCDQTPLRLSSRFSHLSRRSFSLLRHRDGPPADVITVRQLVGSLVLMDPKAVPLDEPLTRYGVDSIAAAEICSVLNKRYALSITQMDIMRGITIDEIVTKSEEV